MNDELNLSDRNLMLNRNLTLEKLLKLKNFSKLDDYINENFSYVKKHEETQLYIVATNDPPKFTYFDTYALDIHRAIIEWVELLMFENNKKKTTYNEIFKGILNNYVIAYGNYNYLSKKSKELFVIYKKILIPIYDTDYLYFEYNNNFIKTTTTFNNINWRPIKNEKIYNQIIEIIMFLIFDILVILYPSEWNYLRDGYLYKNIYNDINNGDYEIGNIIDKNKIIKTYIYQTWLVYINKETVPVISWTGQRKYIEKILSKYSNKGIPYNKDINLKFENIYKYVNVDYNFLDNIEDEHSVVYLFIIIFIILILFIITIYLYFKINEADKLDVFLKNPLRYIIK